jgi:hypothetical protein
MKRLIILFLLIPTICFGANKTINDLTDLGAKPATDDEFILWDSSAGATKKVDYSNLSDLQNVDEFGGLTSAVASFGATPVSLLIDTTQTVSDNLSIPTTMQLVGLRSGSISVASGKVLTLNSCPSLPPDYQFFTGSGTVTNNCAYFIPGAWTGGSGVDFTSATHDHSDASNGGTFGFVQRVNTQTGTLATGSTQIPRDNTIPQNTEGDEYMTLAITPTSATNKLKIDVVLNRAATSTVGFTTALFQDSTANALAAVSDQVVSANTMEEVTFSHTMTAGTTSSTTFKVRAGPASAAAITFNGQAGVRLYGGVAASSITITEYEP